jgi:putative flavoprotein involved in K+ transport
MNNVPDIIVVGAGYSGLCASYHLKKCGLNHLVFERNKAGDSWRTQRWDNFRFNSTNLLNALPGEGEPMDPDLFSSAGSFVRDLEQYVIKHQLPVHENSKVISIDKPGEYFHVRVLANGELKNYQSRQVLIASGASNEKKIPALAKDLAGEIKQLHSSEYKNADHLPGTGVLVVGGAQSGIQITEDLINAGRKVFLSTSEVGRFPRWYRGRDIFYWLKDMKFYDESEDQVKDPKSLVLRPPHVAGTGNGKESLSLQSLAKRGAIILGKLSKANGTAVYFENNAADHIKFADAFSGQIKRMIEEYIIQNELEAPPPHPDEPDIDDINASCAASITELDLEEHNIKTIIWSTGFNHDHSFIKLPVFDDNGKLQQKNGIPEYPGLYFLGNPWLRNRRSTILFGIIEDAEFVVNHICKYAKEKFIVTSAQA